MRRYATYQMRLWLMTALILLLAACSTDDGPDMGQGGGRQTVDSLYVNLRIVNGSDHTDTRAVTDADEQATQAERQIYDGILCIFTGTNETSATLKAACVIDQLVNSETSASGNTAEATVIQRLPSEKLNLSTYNYDSNNLYALLLLNTSHTGLSVSSTGTLYYNGAVITDMNSDGNITIADLQRLELSSIGSIDETGTAPYADPSFHTGLFMSNAPQSEGSVLTSINNSHLYATRDAASSGTQTTIYVERAAAKIMVSSGTPNINFTLNGSGTTQFHKLTWMPDNTMTSYYAVRNTISGSDWTWSSNMNWAYSPNYDGSKTLSSIAGKEFSVYQQYALKDGGAAYVMENTTNAVNSTLEHLTRVIVEVQVKDNSSVLLGDCYTFNGQNTTLYTSPAQLIAAMKSWWETKKTESAYTTKYPHLTGSNLKTVEQIFHDATVTIHSDYSVTLTLQNSTFTAAESAELGQLANELGNLTIGYRDGKMYYSATIQHKSGSPYAYGTLGDYGVVRSHYYKLTLGDISTIGSPTPVLPTVVPISLRMFVVDWKSGGTYQISPN